MTFALLMPAAGSGVRLGAELPKALIEIEGVPLFVRAMRPFVERPDCMEVVIAAPAGHESDFRNRVDTTMAGRKIRVVTGGETRQQSVYEALCGLQTFPELVAVHDAARIFVSGNLIERALAAVKDDCVAALPGLPIADTIKRISPDARVMATVERRDLSLAQTPQIMRREIAEQAFRLAEQSGFIGTDDVSLIEQFGLGTIILVEGDPRNFKITTPADLEHARRMLAGSR